jgi:ATP-dependent Lhr-like helicase
VYTLDEAQDVSAQAARVVRGQKSLFFVESRRDAEGVGQALQESGITAYVHHSSVGRDRREEAEATFTSAAEACIVCTSTLELGLDVGDLDVVVQMDAPGSVSSFLQRMGRTGRRPGSRPHIVFLVTGEWTLLLAIALINLARRGWVEPAAPSYHAVHILVHQVLAQALQHSGVRRERLWEVLHLPACFAQVSRVEFDTLVDHLVSTGILYNADGLLSLGPEGEARFGRQNFLELYSVFETPRQVAVITTQHQEVGTLETWFVQALEPESFVFVLAGRTWQVVHMDLDAALLIVKPAGSGQIPRWSGGLRLLSREVAEEHRSILTSDEQYPFLHRSAQAWLDRLRVEWLDVFTQGPMPVVGEGQRWTLYTFAGGRINTLLARALAHLLDVPVTNDNFGVRVESRQPAVVGRDELFSALQPVAEPGFFDAGRLQKLTASLPRGRLSKFQPLLPPAMEAQFLAERLFDPQGVQELIRWWGLMG